MSENELSSWYRRLLVLLLMTSDPRPHEERQRQRLAEELLEEWLAPRPPT